MKTYINKRLNYTAEVNGESAQVKFTDNGKEVTNAFPAELVIGSPEWELKPSWQILSFKDEEGDIWSLTENGCYAYGKDYASFTLTDMLVGQVNNVANGYFQIHSVRREDGVIFTVGDKTEQGDIISFEIKQELMYVWCKRYNQKNNWYYLEQLTPSKPVLFTTEDGVGLKAGDYVYVINDFFVQIEKVGKHFKGYDGLKYFYSREAVDDWLKWNQPRYSLNDVREWYENSVLNTVAKQSADNFYNFIKNKK